MSKNHFISGENQKYSDSIFVQTILEKNELDELIEKREVYTDLNNDVLVALLYDRNEKLILQLVSIYDKDKNLLYELCYNELGNYTDGYDFQLDDSFLSLSETRIKEIEDFKQFDLDKMLNITHANTLK